MTAPNYSTWSVEMLELPKFDHMTEFESRDKCYSDVMNRNYDFITFISKYLYFKKAQSSQFADIIKIATTFI